MEPHVVIVGRVGPCRGHENGGKLDHRALGPISGCVPLLVNAHGAEGNAYGKHGADCHPAPPRPPQSSAALRSAGRLASLRLIHGELVVLRLLGHLVAVTARMPRAFRSDTLRTGALMSTGRLDRRNSNRRSTPASPYPRARAELGSARGERPFGYPWSCPCCRGPPYLPVTSMNMSSLRTYSATIHWAIHGNARCGSTHLPATGTSPTGGIRPSTSSRATPGCFRCGGTGCRSDSHFPRRRTASSLEERRHR